MNREELKQRLEELGFEKDQYWVAAGGAMVLYGLRAETRDVDMGCTPELADRLQAQGCPVTVQEDGRRYIRFSEDVEISENWYAHARTTVDGVGTITLEGLLEQKRALGREKDLRDIQVIEDYLRNGGETP